MSEELQKGAGPEERGESVEAVVGVREAVEEALTPKIQELQQALRMAELLKGNPDVVDLATLERLAHSVFNAVPENTHQQSLALLLLKAILLLSKLGSDDKKISTILKLAYYLDLDLTARTIEEADVVLREAGIDVVVEVPGFGELCGQDD